MIVLALPFAILTAVGHQYTCLLLVKVMRQKPQKGDPVQLVLPMAHSELHAIFVVVVVVCFTLLCTPYHIMRLALGVDFLVPLGDSK